MSMATVHFIDTSDQPECLLQFRAPIYLHCLVTFPCYTVTLRGSPLRIRNWDPNCHCHPSKTELIVKAQNFLNCRYKN